MSPELAGGFFTIEPPGKSYSFISSNTRHTVVVCIILLSFAYFLIGLFVLSNFENSFFFNWVKLLYNIIKVVVQIVCFFLY